MNIAALPPWLIVPALLLYGRAWQALRQDAAAGSSITFGAEMNFSMTWAVASLFAGVGVAAASGLAWLWAVAIAVVLNLLRRPVFKVIKRRYLGTEAAPLRPAGFAAFAARTDALDEAKKSAADKPAEPDS